MRSHVTLSVRWIMTSSLLCGLVAYALLGVNAAPRTADAPLLAALAHWQAQQPRHYRLVVQQDSDTASCRQEVDVLHDRVQTVRSNPCGADTTWTVSSLLSWIAAHTRPAASCGVSALLCACQLHQATSALYDPTLGYPYLVRFQQTAVPDQRIMAAWQRWFGARPLPGCGVGAGSANRTMMIRVVSITALP